MILNKEKKNIFVNTVALAIIQILNYILPFITLPYLSRILDVDKLGLVFFAQVFMDYFYRFAMFGFDFSGVRSIAINRDNKEKTILIFNSIFSSQILFLIISFIILSLLIIIIPKFRVDAIVYYFTFLSVVGNVLIFTWFYQGMEIMKFITILNIITKTVGLLLIFGFVKNNHDYYLVPLFNSLGAVIAGIVSLIFIKRVFQIKFFIPKKEKIINTIKYSCQFFLTKVAIALYRQTNAFVLGLVVSTTAVAYYTSADKIFWAIFALYSTFINALFPYMSKNKDIIFFKKILKYLIIIAVGFSLFLLITSKYLIILLFTEKMSPAINILKIFALSLCFYPFVDLLGYPLLGAFGYVKETNNGYIIGGIYNLIGLIILYLLNNITIYSIAFLISSTYIIMFLHRVYYVRKYNILLIDKGRINENRCFNSNKAV